MVVTVEWVRALMECAQVAMGANTRGIARHWRCEAVITRACVELSTEGGLAGKEAPHPDLMMGPRLHVKGIFCPVEWEGFIPPPNSSWKGRLRTYTTRFAFRKAALTEAVLSWGQGPGD